MKLTIRNIAAKFLVVPALAVSVCGLVATSAFAQECQLDPDNPLGSSADCTKNPSAPASLTDSITDIVNVLLFIIGTVSVIMIIYGGIQYVLSGGSSEKVQSAKNTILYAIVGVIVAILAYAIVNFVISSFISN